MRPHPAESVPKEDWDLFVKITAIIDGLPERISMAAFILGARMPRSIAISHFIPNCHVMTHALAKFLPIDIHDGVIVEMKPGGKQYRHKHSWLTRKGTDGRIIIDPWPLGVVTGPALFVQDYAFHFGNECCVLENRSIQFRYQVAALRLEIRKVMKRRKIPIEAAT